MSSPQPVRGVGVFARFARWTSRTVGHTSAFVAAVGLVLAWAATGPYFKFSDTWQLVINTSTTVITFLMVFVIQQTQNRDSEAMHVKLDEVIRAMHHAQNDLLDIEDLSEQELDVLRAQYAVLAQKARTRRGVPRKEAAAAAALAAEAAIRNLTEG
ncbi:hypothetical protein BH11MYX4_BH11MYX4_49620 [soil metagenome]